MVRGRALTRYWHATAVKCTDDASTWPSSIPDSDGLHLTATIGIGQQCITITIEQGKESAWILAQDPPAQCRNAVFGVVGCSTIQGAPRVKNSDERAQLWAVLNREYPRFRLPSCARRCNRNAGACRVARRRGGLKGFPAAACSARRRRGSKSVSAASGRAVLSWPRLAS